MISQYEEGLRRAMRPSVEEHIKAMRDFEVADRDASAAEYQEWADRAAAGGDERRRQECQQLADWYRAQRFSWEDDAA